MLRARGIVVLVVSLGFCCVSVLSVCGCRRSEQTAGTFEPKGGAVMAITLESEAFTSGQMIPAKYTGDGKDISPPLVWSSLPEGTKELALIMDDPDAPTPAPWVHWVIYKIPADTNGLPEAIATADKLSQPPGALQGKNSWPKTGYGGPAPPRGHGVHHYYFKLYALDTPLTVGQGIDKNALLKAMTGHILGEGELVGTYQR